MLVGCLEVGHFGCGALGGTVVYAVGIDHGGHSHLDSLVSGALEQAAATRDLRLAIPRKLTTFIAERNG